MVVLRIRGPDGMVRVETSASSTLLDVKNEVGGKIGLAPELFTLSVDPAGKQPLSKASATITALKLEHGQMLHLQKQADAPEAAAVAPTVGVPATPRETPREARKHIQLDPVDEYLSQQSGLVQRTTDKQMCQHAGNVMCEHCMPLEPYDASILREKDLKAHSFQAYLRKLRSTTAKDKFFTLETHSFAVKPCRNHPPWPAAICTECQPRSMTMDRQKFRHVDHVEFQSMDILNTFLSSWRETGLQRYGWLYGKYEPYDYAPLGVKAVVYAIYEPPQISTGNTIDMPNDSDAHSVDELFKMLGLRQVGWIFTDLEPLKTDPSSVVCSRHTGSYFLRSNEVVLAAHLQNQNPSPCNACDDGSYGSKFVTVVVSGSTDNSIEPTAYMVSQQAMDMERDDVFAYCKDPTKARVRVSNAERFLPEIFYKEKSEYGAEITKRAEPYFPLDFMIVSLSVGAPVDAPPPMLDTDGFPIANRPTAHQDMMSVARYVKSRESSGASPLRVLSNPNLLIYLALKTELMSLEEGIPEITAAIAAGDEAAAARCFTTPQWDSVLAAIMSLDAADTPPRATEPSRPSTGGGDMGGAAPQGYWQCGTCTYLNRNDLTACEMCGIPR